MGLVSRLLERVPAKAAPFDTFGPAQRVLPDPYEPFTGSLPGVYVADAGVPLELANRDSIEKIWRSQPNLRKVVDFIARNVASVPLHVYERRGDVDRRRVHDGQLAAALKRPGNGVSPFRFWHSVVSDALLYDRWAVMVTVDKNGRPGLVQIPSWRLRLETDALRRVVRVWYWSGDLRDGEASQDGYRQVPLDEVVFDYGYSPRDAGTSPIETLRDILAESAEAVAYRREIWANGGRFDRYIHRPSDATEWSKEARERFANSMRNRYARGGDNAGGLPLLEDGMDIRSSSGFTPQDAMDIEGRRLTSEEVAAAFHVAPELVGARQGNYSNVREYRQMLYRDSLGPYISANEGALNAQLVDRLDSRPDLYVEANVESKLRGDFIEQAQVKQSATGAPWLTRNEARALENRPPIRGGDALVTPLNVIVGGQASPRDSGSQNRSGAGVETKAAPEDVRVRMVRDVFVSHFERQARVVRNRLGLKDELSDFITWWNGRGFDRELRDDLFRVAVAVSEDVAESTLDSIGFGPDAYDVDATLAFLRSVMDRVANQVNSTTLSQLVVALNADDRAAAVDNVFTKATSSRADDSADTLATTVAGFATVEAAKQVAGDKARKRWVVNSANPRPEHAAMDGETVPIDSNFSNGLPWPGSFSADVDEVAGCQCSVEVIVD